jgi:hypothetical protein
LRRCAIKPLRLSAGAKIEIKMKYKKKVLKRLEKDLRGVLGSGR